MRAGLCRPCWRSRWPRRPAPACWNQTAPTSGSASPTPATPPTSANISSSVDKHPAVIESFRTWGTEFPDSIRRWQTARARPMLHITTADPTDGHEIINLAPRSPPAAGNKSLVRLQQALRRQEDERPTSGRSASPIAASMSTPPTAAAAKPQRTLRQHPQLPPRLPPHLRDRPRRRQGGGDRRTPRRSRAAAPGRRRRRASEGTGGDRLEPATLRSPKVEEEPATQLLPRRPPWVDWVGDQLLRLLFPNGGALSGLYRRYSDHSPSRSPSSASKRAMTRPSSATSSPGSKRTRAARCSSTTRTSAATSTYRIQNYPSSLSVLKDRVQPLPLLRAGAAAPAPAAARRARAPRP